MSNELNEKIEITEEPTVSFEEMGLSEPVLRAIHDMEFSQPTEIQARAIPAVMSGRDIIGRSHTGTGKTMAFGVPAVEYCIRNPECRDTMASAPFRYTAVSRFRTRFRSCAAVRKS